MSLLSSYIVLFSEESRVGEVPLKVLALRMGTPPAPLVLIRLSLYLLARRWLARA
jgi:hypothetical protein